MSRPVQSPSHVPRRAFVALLLAAAVPACERPEPAAGTQVTAAPAATETPTAEPTQTPTPTTVTRRCDADTLEHALARLRTARAAVPAAFGSAPAFESTRALADAVERACPGIDGYARAQLHAVATGDAAPLLGIERSAEADRRICHTFEVSPGELISTGWAERRRLWFDRCGFLAFGLIDVDDFTLSGDDLPFRVFGELVHDGVDQGVARQLALAFAWVRPPQLQPDTISLPVLPRPVGLGLLPPGIVVRIGRESAWIAGADEVPTPQWPALLPALERELASVARALDPELHEEERVPIILAADAQLPASYAMVIAERVADVERAGALVLLARTPDQGYSAIDLQRSSAREPGPSLLLRRGSVRLDDGRDLAMTAEADDPIPLERWAGEQAASKKEVRVRVRVDASATVEDLAHAVVELAGPACTSALLDLDVRCNLIAAFEPVR